KVERVLEIVDINNVETEQLFLGFCEGSIDDERRIMCFAQRRRGSGGKKTQRHAQFARLRQAHSYFFKTGHDLRFLFLAPGPHGIFVAVAQDGVTHRLSLLVLLGRTTMAPADKSTQKCSTSNSVLRSRITH